MEQKVIRAALLGFGTVGTGVYKVLQKQKEEMLPKLGSQLEIKKILVRNLEKAAAKVEDPAILTNNWDEIVNDPDIDIVIELIGGIEPARSYILSALNAGKHVVTANKDLIAVHGKELLDAAEAHHVDFLCEAAVAGGIPIIRPLKQCLAGNHMTEVMGIVNGTTNFILTKMIKEGLPFDTALKQAQEKGYAEADPTADVEGFDACRKICILASLAFGRHIVPAQVPTQGITRVTAEDVMLAEAAGMNIKLLGRAIRQEDGKVTAYVAPHLIPKEQQLAGVEDVFNGIVVRGDAIGDVMFYGRGAGKLPTASAVSADIIDAVKHKAYRQNMDWAPGGDDVVGSVSALPLCWFLRTEEAPERITAAFGEVKTVSAAALPGQTGVLTGPMTKTELEQRLAACKVLTCLPVLD